MGAPRFIAVALLMSTAWGCDDDQSVNPNPDGWLGFQSPVSHQIGGSPVALAVGDVNGDGREDIVTLDTVLDGARLAMGNATGGFTNLGSIAVGAGALDLALSQASDDRITDILVVAGSQLRVSRGSSQGPGAVTNYDVGGPARAIAIGDLNNDLRADVSVVYEHGEALLGLEVRVPRQDDGTLDRFLDYRSADTPYGVRACVMDVTGEGEADVVVATSSPSAPLVLLPNRGGVTFETPVAFGVDLLTGHPGARLACADFNGDEFIDVMVLEPGAQSLLVFFTGSATGLVPVYHETIGSAADIAAIDADIDGDVDFMVARPDDGGVDLVLNAGQGSFEEPALLLTGGTPRYLAVTDVNRDGSVDVVMANAAGTVSILKNTGRWPR